MQKITELRQKSDEGQRVWDDKAGNYVKLLNHNTSRYENPNNQVNPGWLFTC